MHPAVAKLADKDRSQFADLARGKMDPQQASKDALVAVCRVLTGSGGDYDRTPRLDYVKRVQDAMNLGGEAARATLTAALSADGGSQQVPPPPPPTSGPVNVPAPAPISTGGAMPGPNAAALTQLAAALKALGVGGVDEAQIRTIVDLHIGDVAERIKQAVERETRRVTIVDLKGEEREIGVQHRDFPALLTMCMARKADGNRLNVFMSGPAGSGKTRAAEEAAKAMGLDFAFNGAIDTEYKLLGFTDAMGRLVSRPFRRIFEHGGVYLFDECDASMPAALLALNAALANGVCDFPDGPVRRHADCVIIAAANTWGHGATADYVGRLKMDAASLNRFVKLAWPYDEALERKLATDSDWCAYVQKCRTVASTKGLKIVVSPRMTLDGCALLAAGMTREQVATATLFAGLSPDQVAMFPKPE